MCNTFHVITKLYGDLPINDARGEDGEQQHVVLVWKKLEGSAVVNM